MISAATCMRARAKSAMDEVDVDGAGVRATALHITAPARKLECGDAAWLERDTSVSEQQYYEAEHPHSGIVVPPQLAARTSAQPDRLPPKDARGRVAALV